MSDFTFNGKTASSFKCRVEKCPDYGVPQRVVEHISVLGRDGDLLIDTGTYSNVNQIYDIYFNGKSTSFQTEAHKIASWLNGSQGYCRLTDTYDPTVYRMAVVSEYHEYKNFLNKLGRAEVVFSCKPQRWLLSGESEVTLTIGNTAQSVTNDYMACYPIFKLTGNGTLQVNTNYITVANNSGTVIWIDCETQNAYNGVTNLNNKMTLEGEFPYLKSGVNAIKVTGFSAAKMVPRWWTL